MADKQPIKVYRAMYGMSQQDLGNALGVTRQSVCDWEKGKKSPTLKKALKMAEVFRCSIDQIDFFCSAN